MWSGNPCMRFIKTLTSRVDRPIQVLYNWTGARRNAPERGDHAPHSGKGGATGGGTDCAVCMQRLCVRLCSFRSFYLSSNIVWYDLYCVLGANLHARPGAGCSLSSSQLPQNFLRRPTTCTFPDAELGCTRIVVGQSMPMMPMSHAHAHADAQARTRASTGAMPRAPRAYTATRPLAALRCSVSDDSRRPGTPSLAASASSRFRRTTARVLSPRLAELRHSAYSASAASASPGQG